MALKISHDPEIDFLSIDFEPGVEAKSYHKNGVIVRLDKKGHVLGIDITDSTKFFNQNSSVSLQEACSLVQLSESTLRRKIREGLLPYKKPNGKDFRLKKSDVFKLKMSWRKTVPIP